MYLVPVLVDTFFLILLSKFVTFLYISIILFVYLSFFVVVTENNLNFYYNCVVKIEQHSSVSYIIQKKSCSRIPQSVLYPYLCIIGLNQNKGRDFLALITLWVMLTIKGGNFVLEKTKFELLQS